MKEQFLKLYDEKVGTIFGLCYQKTADKELAKSLTESAFMNVWDEIVAGNSLKQAEAKLYPIATQLIRVALDAQVRHDYRFTPSLKLS